jgi:hypothetical protein
MRTGLNDLEKRLTIIEKKAQTIDQDLVKEATNLTKQMEQVYGGYEVLYSYLREKFKLAGGDVKAVAKDKLLAHKDSEIIGFVKGLADANVRAQKFAKSYDQIKATKGKDLMAEIDRAINLVDELDALLRKKGKKLLKSKTYKAKLATYLAILNDVSGRIRTQRVDFDSVLTDPGGQSLQSITKLNLSSNSTIGDIEKEASLGITQEKKKIGNFTNPREFRKAMYGYAKQQKMLRAWASEADALEEAAESEGEEGGGEDSGDGSGKLKAIKIFKGSKEIGTADKGEFKPRTPLKLIVKWGKGVAPLDLLKEKVTIKATWVEAGRGAFMNDCKVDKVGGDMKTITFV